VKLYTDRCIVAILSLESQVVCWPADEERQEIKLRIQANSGFPSCIGFVDGTQFVLEYEPSLDGPDYYSRKGRYGIVGLVVCDDRKRIWHVYSGWPGSAHDARIYDNSRLCLHPDQFFSGDEYLLADSAFSPSLNIVPVFKRPPHSALPPDEARFNRQLSRIQVRVEHCIGILKGRFQSLKGLRIVIRREKDAKRAVYWIRACCVLHNLALQDPVDGEWLEGERDVEDEGPVEGGDGVEKRRSLMAAVLAQHQ
jgi:hypothetical protein